MLKSFVVLEIWSQKPVEGLAIKAAQRAYMIQGVENAFPVADSSQATPVDPSVEHFYPDVKPLDTPNEKEAVKTGD